MTSRHGWDRYDAYLFDVDGTLLHCTDAVHYFAFCDALTEIAGRPMNLEGVVAHGNVDTGILRDALLRSGLPEEAWRSKLEGAREAMRRQVEKNKGDLCAEPTPRAEELLQHLQAQGAKLGVATGNLETIGRLKLAHCGLLGYFDFAGWSDNFEYRKDVFAHALVNARKIAGQHARVCVVGDTPADVQAAQANGLDVIAVATGIYTHEQLAFEGPTWCIRSFEELLQTTAVAES
jgi:phosphoglycolate phosphatase